MNLISLNLHRKRDRIQKVAVKWSEMEELYYFPSVRIFIYIYYYHFIGKNNFEAKKKRSIFCHNLPSFWMYAAPHGIIFYPLLVEFIVCTRSLQFASRLISIFQLHICKWQEMQKIIMQWHPFSGDIRWHMILWSKQVLLYVFVRVYCRKPHNRRFDWHFNGTNQFTWNHSISISRLLIVSLCLIDWLEFCKIFLEIQLNCSSPFLFSTFLTRTRYIV